MTKRPCPPECTRGDEHTHKPACEALVNIPGLMPGWGCCCCTIYNGEQRPQCRMCGHARCDKLN